MEVDNSKSIKEKYLTDAFNLAQFSDLLIQHYLTDEVPLLRNRVEENSFEWVLAIVKTLLDYGIASQKDTTTILTRMSEKIHLLREYEESFDEQSQ